MGAAAAPAPAPAGATTARAAAAAGARLLARAHLLNAIPLERTGAPVTNVTLGTGAHELILRLAAELEATVPAAQLPLREEALALLDGDWRLVFSDASEITRLVKLPLGFQLGEVFQAVRVRRGYFENQAAVRHRFGLARASTRVVANFSLAEPNQTNRAGVVNTNGNRIAVCFQHVVFTLHRLLALPTFDRIRKVATPRSRAVESVRLPTLDVTYLDDRVRVSRGGDGSLFVLVREDSPTPVLDEAAVAALAPTTRKMYNAATDLLPNQRPEVDRVGARTTA